MVKTDGEKLHDALGNVTRLADFEHLLRIPFENRAQLPRAAALYFIHVPHLIVYVGLTSDLKDRLIEHHHIHKFRDIQRLTGNLQIAWFPVQDLKAAQPYEREYIKNLSAPLNYGIARSKAWRQLPKHTRVAILRNTR